MNKVLRLVFGVPLSKKRHITYWVLFAVFLIAGVFIFFLSSDNPRKFIAPAIFWNALWLYFAVCLLINRLARTKEESRT